MFACVHAKHGDLFSLASSFSPAVEQTTPDTVVFSIDGLEKLIGTPHQIASEICRQGAALGMAQGSLAIADDPDTAVLIVRNIRGVTIVPAGEEAEQLADLPVETLQGVEALDAVPEIVETFERWGIRTLGALAALPEVGLAERFGEEGVRLHRLALGRTRRILRLSTPENKFEKRVELEYSIDLLEPLLFVVSSILHELTDKLTHHGLSANRLDLILELENGASHERTQEFGVPLHEPVPLLKLVQVDLEAHPPAAAVVAVRIELNPVPPQTLQHRLFAPSHPAPQKLQLVLTRIAGLVGEHNVGSALLLNTHRPDAFVMQPFSPPKLVRNAPAPPNRSLQIAFRLFRPALSAAVHVKEERPTRVAASGIRGIVLTASGPWRSSGEWWTDTRWARDEWDIDLSDGGIYRIYFRLDSRNWFVEGVYD
jgi:protein ImuB